MKELFKLLPWYFKILYIIQFGVYGLILFGAIHYILKYW